MRRLVPIVERPVKKAFALALACFIVSMIWVAASSPALATTPATAAVADKNSGFIDPQYPALGCMLGMSVGTVSIAFPPMVRWAYVNGGYAAVGAMVMRSGLGCYYGVLGGAVVSGAQSTYRALQNGWSRLF
ncbi:membrane hypothetical protein [Azospirillaceae bacterium]